jgi:hypothetical protein
MTLDLTRPVDATAAAHAITQPPRSRFPELALSISVGLFVVSAAFAAGRAGVPGGQAVFWIGQLIMFLPVVVRFLWTEPSEHETLGVVLVLAVGYYLTKLSYSPLQLEYHDELQHWRTAQDILLTHHLYDYNASLPISSMYPGLEAVTTALSSLTGLSVTASAFVVMGVLRVLFTLALYLLIREVSGSIRVAGLAAVLFTTTFHYKAMLAMFGYTASALAFLVLTMYVAVRLTTARTPGPVCRKDWLLACTCIAVTVVTHHVTSFVLVLALVLSSAVLLIRGRAKQALRVGILALFAVVSIGLWLMFVAPPTLEYIEPAFSHLVDGASDALAGVTPQHGGLPRGGPILDRAVGYSSVLAMAVLLPIGWGYVRRTASGNPWALAMVAGSTLFYLVPAIRLLSSSGSEHAGRVLTYLFVPIGYVLAIATIGLMMRASNRRLTTTWIAVVLSLVMAGGITGGWPPYWERLPTDRPLISGSENGIEPEGLAAAHWSNALPNGSRMAADENNMTIMGPYGDHLFLYGVGPLYYSTELSPEDRALLAGKRISYVVVDRRLSEQLPARGEYFPDDPLAFRHDTPISLDLLMKFDRVPEADRVFDSGNVLIYDVDGVRRAP